MMKTQRGLPGKPWFKFTTLSSVSKQISATNILIMLIICCFVSAQTISGGWVKLLEKLQIEPKKFVEETSDLYESFRSSDITPVSLSCQIFFANI